MTSGEKSKRSRDGTRPPADRLLARVWPPMLATLVEDPPEPEAEWVAELKYDGIRAIAALSKGRVAMVTRNALDLSARFPSIARALAEVHVAEAVIDGEVVAMDAAGAPRFGLLHGGRDALLFVFDLLWVDGEDLRARPLEERRKRLVGVLAKAPDEVRVAERAEGPAADALERARARGYEGLMLKRRGSPYEAGRSRDWLKLKALVGQELAVVGFTPNKGHPRQIGALQLAVADGDGFVHAGKVGTGFSAKLRAELFRDLSAEAIDAPTARNAPRSRETTWVVPRLVAEVRFTEWTADGRLRHPAFVRLRPDKAPSECRRERPAPAPKRARRGSG